MSIKKIVKVWNDKELIHENINFLDVLQKMSFFQYLEALNKLLKI